MEPRPILLVNCLITDDVLSIYDRGLLTHHNKFDVFRYMLKSISVLDCDRMYINFSLSDTYAAREEELASFIAENFPGAHVRPRRLERYGDWIRFIEENDLLSGPPILLMCNDDHIFLPENTNSFQKLLAGYQSLLPTSNMVSVVYSHWQDAQRYQAPLADVQRFPDYDVAYTDNSHDGIQMISPGLMRRWFYAESEQLAPDTLVRRTEDLGPPKGMAFRVIPRKEVFRHFDGYSPSGIGIMQCSPLTIPSGYFEKQMKVCFANLVGKDDVDALVRQGFTICSAATALVGGIAATQPIYDFTPETIPLAWVQQIAEITYYGRYDEAFGKKCHDMLRSNPDLNRPHQHVLSLDSKGAYEVHALPQTLPTHLYLGFHKTPTRTTKKSIFLLQDVKFYKSDQHAAALERAAPTLSAHGIAVHILLLNLSSNLVQGRLFLELNNLMRKSHQKVDSIISLNCSESLVSNDLAKVMDSIYGDTEFCICHNADPVIGLPIMVDALANNSKHFPNDHHTISFVAAGIPNAIGASTNMLIANTWQFKVAFQSDQRLGPDIIESLLNQMEDEKMGIHTAKVLRRT